MTIITWINLFFAKAPMYIPRLKDMLWLKRSMQAFKATHIYRKGNQMADYYEALNQNRANMSSTRV